MKAQIAIKSNYAVAEVTLQCRGGDWNMPPYDVYRVHIDLRTRHSSFLFNELLRQLKENTTAKFKITFPEEAEKVTLTFEGRVIYADYFTSRANASVDVCSTVTITRLPT